MLVHFRLGAPTCLPEYRGIERMGGQLDLEPPSPILKHDSQTRRVKCGDLLSFTARRPQGGSSENRETNVDRRILWSVERAINKVKHPMRKFWSMSPCVLYSNNRYAGA